MFLLQPKLRVSTVEGSEEQISINSRIPQRYVTRWYDDVLGPGTHGFQVESVENHVKFEIQLSNVRRRSSGRSFDSRISLTSQAGFAFEEHYTDGEIFSADYMRCVGSELTEYAVEALRNGILEDEKVKGDLKTITDKFGRVDETTAKAAHAISTTRDSSAICCTSFFCCPMISDYIRNRGSF